MAMLNNQMVSIADKSMVYGRYNELDNYVW